MSVDIELNQVQLERIKRTLGLLPKNLQRKIIREEARSAGKMILAQTKANAPVKSGQLRRAIKLRALRKSRTRVGVTIILGDRDVRSTRKRKQSATGVNQKDTYYGAFVEYGHRVGKRPRDVRSFRVKSIRLRRRGQTQLADQFLEEANRRDPRPFVEGRHFLKRAADSIGPTALNQFADRVAARIEQELAANG